MKEENRSAAGFGAIGLAAAFIFSVSWVVAASADPSWIVGNDYISKLGVSDVKLTADLFNYGCNLVGILMFVYGIGKAYAYRGGECASGLLVTIAGALLFLIGIIHSGNDYHVLISVLLFVFLALAILAAGATNAKEGKMLNAAVCACVLVAAAISFAGISPEMGEAVMVAGSMAWIIADSLKLIFD